MNWAEERQKILDAFEKYPNKKGSRTDLMGSEIPYKRYKLISDELGGRWSTNGRLPMIKEILENDTDTYFFTKGIVKHNWLIPSTYKIYKEGYYQYDKDNDNIIVGKIDNDEILPTTTDIINIIEKHYKISNESFLYFMEIKDGDHLFPYRKIGVSNSLSGRIKTFNTGLPFEVHPIALWNVEYGKTVELETYLHNQLKDVHKKGEWFIDKNFDLIKTLRELIKNIKHIHIKEVFNDDRLKNVDKFSSIMKDVIDKDYKNIFIDNDNSIHIQVNDTEGFGFFGDL